MQNCNFDCAILQHFVGLKSRRSNVRQESCS